MRSRKAAVAPASIGVTENADEKSKMDSPPTIVTLLDSHGRWFIGEVTSGTSEKGSGTFCHVYKSGQYDGKAVVYTGEFVGSFFEGYGSKRYANGDVYQGEFKKSMRHGHGKASSPAGNVYDGEWNHDIAEGKGTYLWPNGEKYTGEFSNGKVNGEGKKVYCNGRVHQGAWKDGLKHGAGEYYYKSGRLIKKGVWKNGIFAGYVLRS